MTTRIHSVFAPLRRPMRRQRRPESVTPELWALLNDQPTPEGGNPFTRLLAERSLAAIWKVHREEVLRIWLIRAPGTRPSAWWRFDAPRLSPSQWKAFAPFHGGPAACCKPRRQVGGKGERAEGDPRCVLGIPIAWARVDPSNPPLFESQAEYLRRHRLLLPGEAKRIKARARKPERLPRRWWPIDFEEN